MKTDFLSSRKIFILLFFLILFFFLLNNSFNYLDPDLGWHLRVGQQIASEKNVPDEEYYNYTLNGETWVDHEWLLDLATYTLFDQFGYITVSVVYALFLALTLLLLILHTNKYYIKNQGLFSIFGIIFFGVLAISPHIGVRMQQFGLLGLLLLIIILEKYVRSKKSTTLWFLPFLFFIWANMHASFLIGFFVFGLFIINKIIENFLKNKHKISWLDYSLSLTAKQIAYVSLAGIISFLATFFTPYGIRLYAFLTEYSNTFYLKHINEWLPAWSYPFQYKQMLYLAILAAIFLIITVNIRQKSVKTKIDLNYTVLAFVFFLLAFKSKRHFPLFFIASFPLIMLVLSSNLKNIPPMLSNIKQFFKHNLYLKLLVFFLFILISALFLVKTNFTNQPFSNPLYCRSYPCQALNLLKNTPKYNTRKIFLNYTWGGFSLWTWPEKQLFIDGRLPIHTYKGHSLLEEYTDFFKEDMAEKKLNEYKIEAVLIRLRQPVKFNFIEKYIFGLKEKEANDKKNWLREYLKTAPKWEMVYNDIISEIYIRVW